MCDFGDYIESLFFFFNCPANWCKAKTINTPTETGMDPEVQVVIGALSQNLCLSVSA